MAATDELWRTIPGYPGYEANQKGEIRAKPRKGSVGNVLREHEGYVTLRIRVRVSELCRRTFPPIED